jgi:hypothetical protein
VIVGAAVVAMLALAPGTGTAGDGIRAVLDGQPISLEQASRLSCHDFDYPVLTCFATSKAMMAAAAELARAGTSSSARETSLATSGYIVVFENGAYSGAARAIFGDYAYLGDIGWNDRISSLKSYGATGHFSEHAPAGGLLYFVSPTLRSSYVGDLYNDKFSAVYLD